MTKSMRRILLSNAPFLLLLSTLCTGAPANHHTKYFMYVGTYTQDGSESKGIYAYRFDSDTGQLFSVGLAAETINPSFLAVHPNHRFLYAVNEVSNYKGEKSGAVSAFAIDHATGKLTLLNHSESRAGDPSYISLNNTEKYTMLANYPGRSLPILPLLEHRRPGEPPA